MELKNRLKTNYRKTIDEESRTKKSIFRIFSNKNNLKRFTKYDKFKKNLLALNYSFISVTFDQFLINFNTVVLKTHLYTKRSLK